METQKNIKSDSSMSTWIAFFVVGAILATGIITDYLVNQF